MTSKVHNSWNQIVKEVQSQPRGPDPIRRRYLKLLHKLTGRNIICYCSGWLQKGSSGLAVGDFIITDADKNGFMAAVHGLDKKKGLDLILHTPGGGIGATESIVDYLHGTFGNDIRVIVPQIAMSAGTLIALASKEIVMGKQSSLGPTDPQLNGSPAGAILDGVRAAAQDIATNPASAGVWGPILSRYTPALIIQAQQALMWASQLATNWLKRNMFAADIAASGGAAEAMVDAIVAHLSTHNQTLSHDRHISMDRALALKLKVTPMEASQSFQDAILRVHHTNMITFSTTGCFKFIENHEGRGTFNQMQMQLQQVAAPLAPGHVGP